jgi:hypothetical protein
MRYYFSCFSKVTCINLYVKCKSARTWLINNSSTFASTVNVTDVGETWSMDDTIFDSHNRLSAYWCPHCWGTGLASSWRPMWRSGENTRLLRKRSRVWFPHSANICVHEHLCLYWLWVFLCIICMYLQKKNVYQYVCATIDLTIERSSIAPRLVRSACDRGS